MPNNEFKRKRNSAIYLREFEEGSFMIALWKEGSQYFAECFCNGWSLEVGNHEDRAKCLEGAIACCNREENDRKKASDEN